MKRFWLVLLSLGLIMAFSVSAFAVDVKFSGNFYVEGMYLDKTGLLKSSTDPVIEAGFAANQQASTAFVFQRLRLKTEFIVAPGLSLTTRATIMDRTWGANRSVPGPNPTTGVSGNGPTFAGGFPGSQTAGTSAEDQNIAIDWAYLTYVSPLGIFEVGYLPADNFGTKFFSAGPDVSNPGITYVLPVHNFVFLATWLALSNGSTTNPVMTGNGNTQMTDANGDEYAIAGIYKFKGGDVGLAGAYWRFANLRPAYTDAAFYAGSSITDGGAHQTLLAHLLGDPLVTMWGLIPWVQAKVGPVKFEAQAFWINGEIASDVPMLVYQGRSNVDIKNMMGAYVDATLDLNMFYVGGMFVYMKGTDTSLSQVTGGIIGTSQLNPTLILFNSTRYRQAGPLDGGLGTNLYSTTGPTQGSQDFDFENGYLFQLRAGVRPTEKLDICASLTYAFADQDNGDWAQSVLNQSFAGTQATWYGNTYGTELDVTASYKINNNLTYMLGGGYLWTGDYWKGSYGNALISLGGSSVGPSSNTVQNDYMVMNKLTLTF